MRRTDRRPLMTTLAILIGCQPGVSDLDLPGFVGAPPPDEGTPFEDAEPLDPADMDGQCGEVHFVDMTLTGYVVDTSWTPVAGVDVWLEERNWTPPNSHGEAVTGADGRYELPLTDVPIVENCWGIGPQFFVMSEQGVATCEVPANMQLVIAWLDETLEADISGYPCMLVDD